MSRLRAYLQLVRFPNVFTAIADVVAGYWLLSREAEYTPTLLLIVVASAALYSAGIVFNDLHDVEIDRKERPARPLPSGRITLQSARKLAIGLSALGVLAAAVAAHQTPLGFRHPAAVGLALLGTILAYDLWLKETLIAPVVMGACRGLNLLLGISAGSLTSDGQAGSSTLLPAVALALYVTSLTYFGRQEAASPNRRQLVTGIVGVAASLLILGLFAGLALARDLFALVLWLALCIHLARVGLRAIRNPRPSTVQYAMKAFIFCIIVFDATIVAATQNWPYSVVVLSLLIPAFVAGRYLYST